MDFGATEQQRILGDLAAEIVDDHATHERLAALEAEGDTVFDRDLWAALAGAGVLGAVVDEDHGGAGLGLMDLVLVLEAAGRAVAPVPLVETLVLGALALRRFGTDEQRARWLPGVADGSVVLTAALDGPATDGRADPPVTAARDGGGWRLTGGRPRVAYGQHADRVLTPAASDDAVIVALVDPTADGVTLTEQVPTNRRPAADLTLDGVTIAAADVLAGPPDGAAVTRWLEERGAAATCVVQAGVCDRALTMTARHTADREQFGKPIAEFQAVAQRAADAFIDTTLVRLTAHQALFLLDREEPAAAEVAVAKFWAGDGGMRVVHACQHLHGGIGVDTDYPLHRYFLWAKQLEHTLGTPTRELIRLGAVLADEPV